MSIRDEPSGQSDRKEWIIAWALALALHVAAIVFLGSLSLFNPSRSDPPEPVEVILTDDPRFFTEQPADRADPASENPDFLSNVASRARDQVPDGDAALPRLQGESRAPAVKLDPSQTSPPSAAPDAAQPQSAEPGITPSPPAGSPAPQSPPGLLGNSDIREPEMDNPGGNAALTGDVTLSTTDWDYSPWIQRFGRELRRRWIAPQAYYLGLLKDGGWALIDMEVTPAGKVLRVDLVDQQGHSSLILAAHSAVRAVNPVEPLPAGFPEPTLILRIRMVYPKYSEVRRPTQSVPRR
jgi:hypothetical protein